MLINVKSYKALYLLLNLIFVTCNWLSWCDSVCSVHLREMQKCYWFQKQNKKGSKTPTFLVQSFILTCQTELSELVNTHKKTPPTTKHTVLWISDCYNTNLVNWSYRILWENSKCGKNFNSKSKNFWRTNDCWLRTMETTLNKLISIFVLMFNSALKHNKFFLFHVSHIPVILCI